MGQKKAPKKSKEHKKASPDIKNKKSKSASVAGPKPVNKKSSGTPKPVNKKSSGTPKPANKKTATGAVKKKSANSHKSETMKAYERQKKLEDTMPLGGAIMQATSKIPVPVMQYRRTDRWGLSKKIHDFKKNFGKTVLKAVIIVLVTLALLAAVILVINRIFKVETVTIEGNRHYSNEEICDMVLGDRFGQNSLYLSLKYKNKDIDDIPFIETMNVNIESPSAIKITVYEKAVAGFVEYMGKYFYFDKDGTVIESSDTRTSGIPQVLGLDFDHIILYDKLPVESEEVFKNILEMTHLLEKYGIDMEKIYFDKDFNMTLYFGDARIKIGDFENIDEKIIRLKDILPELEGKKGVLRLDSYNGTDSIITFEVD